MDKNQRAEIQKHLEANARLLGEVVDHENSEREQMQNNLQEFNSAINRCETEVIEKLTLNHQRKMSELEEQSAKLHAALQSDDLKEIEKLLKQM